VSPFLRLSYSEAECRSGYKLGVGRVEVDMMRQFHTKHPRKLKLLLVLAVPAATLACKPARSANLTATLTAPDTTSESNEAHFAALNDTENSLSKCEYYLSYNYNSPDSDSYSAQRAGIFPQSSDFLRTSIELWHSGISDLSSAANKCKIKIPYIERVSIVYSEYLKSQCVADFLVV
jgi:hypothetical protein